MLPGDTARVSGRGVETVQDGPALHQLCEPWFPLSHLVAEPLYGVADYDLFSLSVQESLEGFLTHLLGQKASDVISATFCQVLSPPQVFPRLLQPAHAFFQGAISHTVAARPLEIPSAARWQ